MKLAKIIGENVRGFRLAQGFSREEFAKKAKLHLNYLGAVERGEKNVTAETIEHLSNILGFDSYILLTPGACNWNKRKFGK